MCNKNSPLTSPRTRIRTRTRTRSLLHNDVVQHRPLKASSLPARRSRTKTRKPKYLSLRLQLSKETENDVVLTPSSEITEMTSSRHHQLNLFPLHPENLVNDATADDNVALLFNSDGGASSLNGLLPTATAMSEEEDSTSQAAERRRFDREYNYLSEDEDHHHHKFYYVDGRGQRGNCSNNNKNSMNSLVRTAMRNRERDMSEEKWVSYSEVVEEVTSSSCSTEILEKKKKKKIETTSSSSRQGYNSNNNSISSNKNLALKLDYQEILKAWSDKGSLYIQGDSPQTVPDLQDNSHGLGDGWGNLWQVPENEGGGNVSGRLKIKEEGEAKDGWKLGQREASVLRYKEKRQSRLFAKRIRYEVRKLNAEKRPRMKGRFVKIS